MVMAKKKKITAFDVVLVIVFGLFAFITVYPFWFLVIGSFSNGNLYAEGGVWLYARGTTIANYYAILVDRRLWVSFGVTAASTVLGTATGLLFTSMVAYAISRKQLKYRRFFQNAFLFTMFFGGGLVPYFMVIVAIGLYDNFLVYILPSLFSVYNMIIISNFFRALPDSLRESAVIDGANDFVVWMRIYMPLSKAVLATVGLWLAVGHWNNYQTSLFYTRSENLQTLQLFLAKMLKEESDRVFGLDTWITDRITPQTLSYAAIVVASLPIICVYPFISKYFAKGILVGSLKG